MTSPQKIGAFRNREFGERSDFLNNNGEKSFKEHIEIFRDTYGTRFEAWRVLIDPRERLYPVHWKWDEGKFENREFAVRSMKRRYPALKIRFYRS